MEMVRIAAGSATRSSRRRRGCTPTSELDLAAEARLSDAGRLDAHGPARQALVVTPFTPRPAPWRPVTMAGAVAQSIAEALAPSRRPVPAAPGCPVRVFGTFTSNVDMNRARRPSARAQHMRATEMTGQLARFTSCRCGLRGCARRMCRGRAGDVETSNSASGGSAVGDEHGLSRRRVARGRADRQPGQVHHGSRAAAA